MGLSFKQSPLSFQTFLLACFLSIQVSVSMQVADFAAKPFVKRALQKASTPSNVISFFFGVDYESKEGRKGLEDGSIFKPMGDLWFSGGPMYDKLCQPFAPLIRKAGRSELVGDEWNSSVDGVMSQLLLCDQIARNVFRGTQEAFAYDETALVHARSLTANVLELKGDKSAPLPGTLYPPYLSFVSVALMHSEYIEDHENMIKVLKHAKSTTPDALIEWWDYQLTSGLEHKEVIDRFGRYPHRNMAKGRESTSDEEAWLADVDHMPGWAKSQLPQESQ